MGWLIALAILILLAFLPLGLSARWDAHGSILELRVGFLRVYVEEDKNQPEGKRKKSVKKITTGRKEIEKTEEGGLLSELLPDFRDQLYFLNELRKKLWVKKLVVRLTLGGEDPCDLAMQYGRANAIMNSLVPLLEQCFTIRRRDLQIQCDFDAKETVFYARAELRITLIRFLGVCWRYVKRSMEKQNNTTEKSSKGGTSL